MELFDRIDQDGGGALDWDEFTTFCVENGMRATSVKERRPVIRHTVSSLSAPSNDTC